MCKDRNFKNRFEKQKHLELIFNRFFYIPRRFSPCFQKKNKQAALVKQLYFAYFQ